MNSVVHMSQNNDLKQATISLLQQLGLYAQASHLLNDQQSQPFDTLSLNQLLKKHKLSFRVLQFSPQMMAQTSHPCLFIPDNSPAQVIRRRHEHLEQLGNNDQWQPLTAKTGGHILIVDSLPTDKQNTKAFAHELSKKTKWYRPVFWLSLLASITGLAVPLFTMAVYDRVIGGQSPSVLPTIALGAALAISILVSSRLVRAKVLANTSNRFARDLSNLTFDRLLSMPLTVLSRVGLSNHISRMRNAEKMRVLLSGPAGTGLVDVPFTLIALVTIALLSGWLVVVPLSMLALFYWVMKLTNKFTQSASPTISSDYQQSLNELAKNLLQVKTSGHNEGWYVKFCRQCREHCRQNFIYAKRSGLNAAVAHAMSLFTALVTVFTGIFLVLNQSISPGALIACVMLIWRITGPAQLAFSSSQKITMVKSAAEQFDRFMTASTEHNELRLDLPDTSQAPQLSFQHLTLRYSADAEPALSGISVDIDAGENVAIIGPNACGKTSLLLAAIGVVESQAGFVTINGKNLKQYDPQALRQWAAYSPAQADLLPGTLADNIRISMPSASDEELINALYAAGGAALFDALDNNIHCELFKNGHSLLSPVESGYISLARALLKQSQLILLDEPIANQNPHAKAQLLETFAKLKGNTTVLFTSHDADLIQQADKVIILDKGTVVYAGPVPDPSAPNSENSQLPQESSHG
ncbi:peptidase domain-containing ABC transporter [Shewanella sp. WXL01]|uniref:peptidase domain-containing ABC transporter n=1 Tax=Shewanella sp. WXL01 TaxID=2709721 RepID=UPI001FD8BAB7|nr:ABC transporter transmembrane domain-containing protein [Shewanella sp. WXL01]